MPWGKGATTIWEHWDGIMENGEFWSTDMNSFNHYAYGSVADWIYEQAAGIRVVEEHPGFEKAWIQPKPGDQLEWLGASIETRHGKISSWWTHRRCDPVRDRNTGSGTDCNRKKKNMLWSQGSYIFWK